MNGQILSLETTQKLANYEKAIEYLKYRVYSYKFTKKDMNYEEMEKLLKMLENGGE